MRKYRTILTCLVALVVVAATGRAVAQAAEYRVEEKLLGRLHDVIQSPAFSKDGCHLAYATSRGAKWLVVVDGVEGPAYDGIIENGPSFRENGALEYLADKAGSLYRVHHIPVEQ